MDCCLGAHVHTTSSHLDDGGKGVEEGKVRRTKVVHRRSTHPVPVAAHHGYCDSEGCSRSHKNNPNGPLVAAVVKKLLGKQQTLSIECL